MGWQSGPVTPSANTVGASQITDGSITQADIATFSGTIAARPAAVTSVAPFYMATDIAGGQPYFNTGAAWVPAGPSTPVSLSTVTTFTGTGQAGATDVTLWTPSTVPTAMWAIGTQLRIEVGLDIDILSSATARNLVFKVAIGATNILTGTYTVLASSAVTNQGAMIQALVTCYATGAGGNVRGQGQIFIASSATTLRPVAPFSTGTNVVAVDLSAARAVTVTVNESVNSVADVVRIQTGNFMVLNPV